MSRCQPARDPFSSGKSGLAFTCDSQGNVQTVVMNDFEPSLSLTPGLPAFSETDSAASDSYQQFVEHLCEAGEVFGWEISTSVGSTPVTLFLYGVSHESHLAVVGSTSHQHIIRMLDEYLSINNSLVNKLRELQKERAAAARSRPEDRSMVELLELNNEMVTLQRQMAQRNKELSRRERFIRSIITASPNLVYVYDLGTKRITFVNEAAEKILGREPDEVLSMRDPIGDLNLAPEQLEPNSQLLEGLTLRPDENATVEWSSHVTKQSGSGTWLLSRATMLENDSFGQPTSIMVIATDITELRQTQTKLRELATHDQMTSLLNRRGLFSQVATLMAALKRTGSPVSVLMVDLDGVKIINDTFGHTGGDAAICDTAKLLRTATRESDIVSRVGGDEFVVFAPDTDAAGASALESRIREAIERHNNEINMYGILSASIGSATAVGPEEYDFQHLLNVADQHMYEEKNSKKAEG